LYFYHHKAITIAGVRTTTPNSAETLFGNV